MSYSVFLIFQDFQCSRHSPFLTNVLFFFFMFFSVSHHISCPTVCVSHFPWFSVYSPYSMSYRVHFPKMWKFFLFFCFFFFLVLLAIFLVTQCLCLIFPFFNFLVFFQVLHCVFLIFQLFECAFLIFHVFQCFLPYSRSYSVRFSFSTFFQNFSSYSRSYSVCVSFSIFFSFLPILQVL